MFDAGLFTAAYVPLGSASATATVADNSTLHCGDCHTVGQWKPFTGAEGAGNFNMTSTGAATTAPIGAHGSNSEYMLRNANGTEAFGYVAPTGSQAGYVCYLCHLNTKYTSGGAHNTISSSGGNCNGTGQEGIGKKYTDTPPRFNTARSNSRSTVFGMTCSNCHNAGQHNGYTAFGGIHGSAATYLTYSGNTATASIVSTKSYRFLGGMSFKYNGGATPAGWEKLSLIAANREGCYNLGTSTNQLWNTTSTRPNVKDPQNIFNTGANATVSDPINTQFSGGWGACSDHTGSATAASGTHAITRGVQRPLSY
jgi:hypothetical protein